MKKVFSALMGIIMVSSLSLQGVNVHASQITPYDINVYEEEPNNDPMQAAVFEINNKVYGEVDGNDVDFFKVDIKFPGNFKLYGAGWDSEAINSENYEGLLFTLFDEDFNLIAESEYFPPDENNVDHNIIDEIVSPGTYYVGVENANNVLEEYVVFTDLRLALDRLAGASRYTTAVSISQAGWDTSNTVVLTTGGNFPDALSATPLAAQYGAPLLLTQPNRATLTPEVKTEIKRLKAKQVFIVGGTGAVSKGVEQELQKMGAKVIRIAGSDRYETAVKVAEQFTNNGEIAVATGSNFADALSMSSIAAAQGMPILLTKTNELPATVRNYLTKNNISKSYVIGGTGAVSDVVKKQLPSSERISGADRYATNAAILKRFADDIDFTLSFVATGVNYPDALAGSALAAGLNSPIILTNTVPATPIINMIEENKLSIAGLIALGGTSVLSEKTIQTLASHTNPALNK